MWYAALMRFLRRRIVLGVIFTLSLTYCIVSFIDEEDFGENDVSVPVRRTQPFIWRSLQELNNSNETEYNCRNSIQGQMLLVDERGFVCERAELQPNGCCTNGAKPQYSCESCKNNKCCRVYEFCVSCCLHPDKKPVLENILGKATEENNVLFTAVSDHFELCLAKCRTNSLSVQHENSYKDPEGKYCFGETPPTTSND